MSGSNACENRRVAITGSHKNVTSISPGIGYNRPLAHWLEEVWT